MIQRICEDSASISSKLRERNISFHDIYTTGMAILVNKEDALLPLLYALLDAVVKNISFSANKLIWRSAACTIQNRKDPSSAANVNIEIPRKKSYAHNFFQAIVDAKKRHTHQKAHISLNGKKAVHRVLSERNKTLQFGGTDKPIDGVYNKNSSALREALMEMQKVESNFDRRISLESFPEIEEIDAKSSDPLAIVQSAMVRFCGICT